MMLFPRGHGVFASSAFVGRRVSPSRSHHLTLSSHRMFLLRSFSPSSSERAATVPGRPDDGATDEAEPAAATSVARLAAAYRDPWPDVVATRRARRLAPTTPATGETPAASTFSAAPPSSIRVLAAVRRPSRRRACGGEKEALEDSARGLQGELEAERASAERAASEAMLMIERLQREKAAAQMEARQFKRYAEGRADHEREAQEEMASLSDLAASYHSRLQSHGIDPDTFSDEELYEEQRGHLEHSDLLSSAMVAPEEEANGGDLLSSAMDVKTD
ncbi:uncharacterized protein LOC124664945 [Lolium rigidum]|uniref:uncharacterized protein LOC124664945 n=1 Tax=Lolium rigidum TaxID=89674 RepID=UPI001F5D565D|nr:uncharacterized protein LOC124664945 [Lolium rigidum]